ncbi:MAG: putative zinc-binding protein [Isosphaeraceae bacterium]
MDHSQGPDEVLIIPCSGIGKVHGLVGREATYSALELLPGQAETVCLALLVTGDPATRQEVREHPSITVDGCPKLCAQKNVELAGGKVALGVRVYETMKRHRGENFGTVTTLSTQGLAMADEIGGSIAAAARGILEGKEGHHG